MGKLEYVSREEACERLGVTGEQLDLATGYMRAAAFSGKRNITENDARKWAPRHDTIEEDK